MEHRLDRRAVLELIGLGGLAFAAGLAGCGGRATAPGGRVRDFSFLQLSDTHWGFEGPANPEASVTLEHAVEVVNASLLTPDFVVFTGDLTQTTNDDAERRRRMARFKEIVSKLRVKGVHFLPGEHDAARDHGEAYRESFGPLYYAFDHGGVRFLALDNASRPGGALGDDQLHWLDAEVKKASDTPLVTLAHRPLFDLFPAWEWSTRDGAAALEILQRHEAVTVFYGHVHQEHHHRTAHIPHHAARSLVFPLPAPGSMPEKTPPKWDPAARDHGLGYRAVELGSHAPNVRENPLA
jgi:hypothetical protein